MEQHHAIRRAVNDDRKEIQNVAAEHADVQYFVLQTRRIGAAQRNPLTVVARQANLCRNVNRSARPPTPPIRSLGSAPCRFNATSTLALSTVLSAPVSNKI